MADARAPRAPAPRRGRSTTSCPRAAPRGAHAAHQPEPARRSSSRAGVAGAVPDVVAIADLVAARLRRGVEVLAQHVRAGDDDLPHLPRPRLPLRPARRAQRHGPVDGAEDPQPQAGHRRAGSRAPPPRRPLAPWRQHRPRLDARDRLRLGAAVDHVRLARDERGEARGRAGGGPARRRSRGARRGRRSPRGLRASRRAGRRRPASRCWWSRPRRGSARTMRAGSISAGRRGSKSGRTAVTPSARSLRTKTGRVGRSTSPSRSRRWSDEGAVLRPEEGVRAGGGLGRARAAGGEGDQRRISGAHGGGRHRAGLRGVARQRGERRADGPVAGDAAHGGARAAAAAARAGCRRRGAGGRRAPPRPAGGGRPRRRRRRPPRPRAAWRGARRRGRWTSGRRGARGCPCRSPPAPAPPRAGRRDRPARRSSPRGGRGRGTRRSRSAPGAGARPPPARAARVGAHAGAAR